MIKVFSKKEPELLLHIINKFTEIERRTDVAPESEFLQLATLKLNKGDTFRPHYHIFKDAPPTTIAQESWVVIQGRVKIIMYDIDNVIIQEEILNPGDCSMTFRGGHNYVALEQDTIVYEYKSGPYYGQKFDKRFIT